MKPTEFDRTLNIMSIVLLIGTPLFLLLFWGHLPDKIPIRYDFAGNITGYGGKASLLLMPVLGFVFYMVFTFVDHMPVEQWNTGIKVTRRNKEWVYGNLRHMLSTMKLGFTLIVAVFTLYQALGRTMPGWLIAIEILFIPADIVFWLVRASKKK